MSNESSENRMNRPDFRDAMMPRLRALGAAMARQRQLKLLRAKAKVWGIELSAPELDGISLRMSCRGHFSTISIEQLSVDTIEAMIDEAIAHAKRVLAS